MNIKKHPFELEIIFRQASTPSSKPPLLFVHGAYVAAWCWDEFFLSYFADKGHDVYAVSLRGHGKSQGASQMALASLSDYIADLRHAVSVVDGDPIIIGHSMGGMILQKYLEQHSCKSAVLMASVPSSGLFATSISLAMRQPFAFLTNPASQQVVMNGAMPTVGHRELFHEDMPHAEVKKHLSRMQSISARALHDMTWLNLPRKHNPQNIPMLVLAAENDSLFSLSSQRTTARLNRADFDSFPDMSHTMMLEPNWQQVADKIANWV